MLGKNSSSSRWVDVEGMALTQEIEVVSEDKKIVTEQFVKNLAEYRKTSGYQGAGKNTSRKIKNRIYNLN